MIEKGLQQKNTHINKNMKTEITLKKKQGDGRINQLKTKAIRDTEIPRNQRKGSLLLLHP